MDLTQDAFFPLRKKYWERFGALAKNEAWPITATAPRRAAQTDIDSAIWPECRSSFIVFVDGHFDETLSRLPADCICLPLDEAMKTYGLILQSHLMKEIEEETEPAAALNGAIHGRALFLYVPPNISLAAPLQIISILSSKNLMAPRLQIFMGKHSSLDIVEIQKGDGMAISCIDAVLDDGSRLNFADEPSLSGKATLFRSLRATVKRDARLSSFSYRAGALKVHQSLRVSLCEEGAEAVLSGLEILQDGQEGHTRSFIEHRSPHCRSRQHFKKVLRGNSRSSFEGKILVRPIAQKTEAYQLIQNLLLSDSAVAVAKPDLEIFADDVKATHGATIGPLDEEEIYYCRARGLSEIESKELLLKGFCRELIDGIEISAMRGRL
jgi:Fe-S cluster assembly protein SufD